MAKIQKIYPMKVGTYYSRIGRVFAYRDVKSDEDGWVSPDQFLPEEFEIMSIQTEEGKIKKGWFSGLAWDGSRVKRTDKIIKWRRDLEEMDFAA